MKTRFLLGVLLLFSITMQGQQVKVNYENITNSLPIILQEYFRMQGVQHLNLTIKGEFNGKRAKLKKISCNNGVFTERELLPDFVHFKYGRRTCKQRFKLYQAKRQRRGRYIKG